jgi:hypothetical protein
MIRLLTETDRKSVLNYLYQEPEFNIFPIGDIETFGFDQDFQRVYGEFDQDGQYLSILLRYRVHAIYYADQLHFNEDYLKIFKDDPFEHLSGKSQLIDLMKPYLSNYKYNQMYFCKATSLSSQDINPLGIEIQHLKTRDEARKIHDLLLQIPEFRITKDPEGFVDGKMQSIQMGECLFIKEKDKVISTVSTTAETTKSAMVVAVATDKNNRHKGYASLLMKRLMSIYFEEKKKSLCLFYDNPEAGKIYLRLGFKEMGTWTLCDLL